MHGVHCTATPALTIALSCPKLGPNTVVGGPEMSTRRAEIGSRDSLYSCSQAALTKGRTPTRPTCKMYQALKPRSVRQDSSESPLTATGAIEPCSLKPSMFT